MVVKIPTLRLANANNIEIPAIGLGCWGGVTKEERAKSKDWILSALKSGYRLLDTAYGYGTEQYVGEAIRESGIPREEIFVITKLPTHHHRKVQESIDRSLKNLGMDYVDLYLMHFPQAVIDNDDDNDLVDENGNAMPIDDGITFNETYAHMEEALAVGKARAIGVSNFSIKTLTELLKTAKVVPALNEVEMHPLLAQESLKAFHDARGILTCAYSPSGWATVREDPTILELAKKYGVESTQIIMAWHVKRGVIPIPKSSNERRQRQNIDLPVLSDEDFAMVSAMDQNRRLCNAIGPDGKCYGWTAEQYGW